MKKAILFLIRQYRRFLSPDIGIFRTKRLPTCVFYPTCSDYSTEAIKKYGAIKGMILTIKRIARCHPWQKNHFDPVL